MKIIRGSKLKEAHKTWAFWLILITGLAIVLRSIPGWIYTAWGCDFGIYFGITKSIAETKIVFPPYTGWGSSYNEFPVLYLVNAFAHWVTGIDIFVIMPKLTPVFGGLSVFIFYFIVYELFKNRKVALLSTLFFAVIPFHVYQTSHASPLTMGHFFMMLSMYLFIKYRKDTRYTIPLLASTMLLIMSHHLTTYFYLIILAFVVFIENIKAKTWTKTIKKDFLYLLASSALVFLYWGLVAKTVYEDFISSGFSIAGVRFHPIFVMLLFYVLFFAMFGVIKLIKRLSLTKIISSLKARFLASKANTYGNKISNLLWFRSRSISERFAIKFSIMMVASLSLMIFFSAVTLPWTNFKLTVDSIVYSLPFLVITSLAVAGFSYTYRQKNGLLFCGWFAAVIISLIFALATSNNILLPDRHMEYLMAPIAVMAVFGLGGIFSDPSYKELLSHLLNKKKIRSHSRAKLVHLFVVIILVVSLASTTYVAYESLNAAVEEITAEDNQVVIWMSENLDKNTSLIASDHRLARLAEAYGFNTTKDETSELWDKEKPNDYIDELFGIGKGHDRITHVVIDDIMKNDVVHVYFGDIKYMTNETWTAAYDKFNSSTEPIFNLIYRNETTAFDLQKKEPVHWAEIYAVNWTYIDENLALLMKD